AQGRITAHGRALAGLPLHPRLGHMLVTAGSEAATLAALLADRDPLRGAPADLALRLAALRDTKRYEAEHPDRPDRAAVERIRAEAKRLAALVGPATAPFTPAEMAALAYPDRIGLRRKGEASRYVLSGGKGAVVAEGDPLGRARLMVAPALDGGPREARVRQGIALPEASLRRLFGPGIVWQEMAEWSRREGRVVARRQQRFGALVLDDRPWPEAPAEALARAALDGLRQIGLPWSGPARRLRARIALLRAEGAEMPDVSDEGLLATAGDWLLPHLAGRRNEADLRALDLAEPLRQCLTWEQQQDLEKLAPAQFTTPLGRQVPIDYE